MPLPSSESSSESSSPHSTEMCSMTTTSSITDSIEGSPCKYIFFQILKSHLFFQVFFFWCSICITQLVATHLASFIRLLKLFNATTIGMFIWVHRVSPLFFVSSFVSSPKVWTLSKLRVASQVVELEELKSGKFSTQEKSDFLKSFVSSVRSSLQIQAPLYMDCSNPFFLFSFSLKDSEWDLGILDLNFPFLVVDSWIASASPWSLYWNTAVYWNTFFGPCGFSSRNIIMGFNILVVNWTMEFWPIKS